MPGRLLPLSLAGSIWYLPRRDKVKLADRDGGPTFPPPEAFDHPAVVLSKATLDGKVTLLMITSFGETPLRDRHPDSFRCRSYYLPIHPSERHPDSDILLTLGDGMALEKASYVNVKNIYTVPFSILRTLRTGEILLTPQSYEVMRKSMDPFVSWVEYSEQNPTTTTPRRDGLQDPPRRAGSLIASHEGRADHLDYGTSLGFQPGSDSLRLHRPSPSLPSYPSGRLSLYELREPPNIHGRDTPLTHGRLTGGWTHPTHYGSWLPSPHTFCKWVGILLWIVFVVAALYSIYLACLAMIAYAVALGQSIGRLPGQLAKLLREWVAKLFGSDI